MKPTVGRVIYIRQSNINDKADDAPFAGLITAVNSDDNINVAGWNSTGCPIVANNCPLVPPGGKWPASGTFAHWMDYQIQAAAKDDRRQEALEIRSEELAPKAAKLEADVKVEKKTEEPDPATQKAQMAEIEAAEKKHAALQKAASEGKA